MIKMREWRKPLLVPWECSNPFGFRRGRFPLTTKAKSGPKTTEPPCQQRKRRASGVVRLTCLLSSFLLQAQSCSVGNDKRRSVRDRDCTGSWPIHLVVKYQLLRDGKDLPEADI